MSLFCSVLSMLQTIRYMTTDLDILFCPLWIIITVCLCGKCQLVLHVPNIVSCAFQILTKQ